MGTLLLLVIGFGVGAYFGHKYPQKVEQATEFTKKTFNDIKDKLSKKEPS